MKKFFIIIGVILFFVIIITLFTSYKSFQLSREKCGHLTQQHGQEFIYKEGAGCVAKEAFEAQKNYKKEQIKEKGYDAYLKEGRMKSRDAARMADINQIERLITEFYFKKHGNYPKSLTQLAEDYSSDNLIYDNHGVEAEKILYNYATKEDTMGNVIDFHLGTSIENNLPRNGAVHLTKDDDFNSETTGWTNGFNGDDSSPCNENDIGKFCYDIKSKK